MDESLLCSLSDSKIARWFQPNKGHFVPERLDDAQEMIDGWTTGEPYLPENTARFSISKGNLIGIDMKCLESSPMVTQCDSCYLEFPRRHLNIHPEDLKMLGTVFTKAWKIGHHQSSHVTPAAPKMNNWHHHKLHCKNPRKEVSRDTRARGEFHAVCSWRSSYHHCCLRYLGLEED